MKKKILIISQFFWPNNFRINDLVSKLSDKKYDIEILSSNYNYIKNKSENNLSFVQIKFPKKNFQIYRVPVFGRKKSSTLSIGIEYLSFIFSAIWYGNKYLKFKNFDKIFVYGTSPIIQAFVALYFKKIFKAPVILWVQDLWPQSVFYTGYIKNKFILYIIEIFVKIIYKKSDTILVQSKGFVKLIKKIYNHKKIFYLPNPPEELKKYKKKLFFKKKLFNVVYAGNFGEAQNLKVILNAANLLKKNKKIHFYFFGDSSKASELISLKNNLNLTNCFFAGYVRSKNFSSILKQSSALIFGLKSNEIWSNTIPSKFQTYLQAGRPIVGYIDGITANIIKKSKCGIVCGPNDYVGLSKSLIKLSNFSKKNLDKMGSNGKSYCNKNYNLRFIAKKFEEYL